MMKPNKRLATVALLLGFAVTLPASAAPGTGTSPQAVTSSTANTQGAAQVVKNFYVKLADVMKDGDRLGYAGRYKKLEPEIKSSFNLPLMTRFAVGPQWAQATPGEQKQLVSAFSDFSVATYASRFTKYDGEKFEVTDQKPANGGGLIIETKLTPGGADAKPVSINYLMKQDDKGSWRIVDVFLDGAISELATRRSEFSSIVEHDGINGLVNDLGEKSREMGPS